MKVDGSPCTAYGWNGALELTFDQSPRQKIVTGARRRFFTHGIKSVTMDELAEELGMSKKTLYAHFPSKTALVEAVMLEKFQHASGDLERITSDFPADFTSALHQLLACMQKHTDEIRPAFVRDIMREAPEMFKVVETRRRELLRLHFRRLLDAGRKAGIIRTDISAELVMEILLGAVQAIMTPPKMDELGLTPKTGFTSIITVILEGVITEKERTKP